MRPPPEKGEAISSLPMKHEQVAAAKKLLAARAVLLQAEAFRAEARQHYIEAEKEYLGAYGNAPADNLLLGKTVVMVKEDWYDLKDGERLEYHTVEVAE